jgi:flagellar motor component MotA
MFKTTAIIFGILGFVFFILQVNVSANNAYYIMLAKAFGFVFFFAGAMALMLFPENEEKIFVHDTPQQLIIDICDIAVIFRRDGQMVAENYVQKLKDPILRGCLQQLIQGHEWVAIHEVINNQRKHLKERISRLIAWVQFTSDKTQWVGVMGSVVMLMQKHSIEVSILPLGFGILLSGIFRTWFDQSMRAENYFEIQYIDLLDTGIAGVAKGVHVSLLESQMQARLGHISKGTKENVSGSHTNE